MQNISLQPYEHGQQAFVIEEGSKKLAEMVMKVSANTVTVYHTEVFPEVEGKGLGKLLLEEMADYARRHQLTVVPLCSFVQAQFKRHPELYSDIWQKDKA